VLITGAAGMIGSRLVAKLLARGFEVRALVLPGDPLAAQLKELDCAIHEGDVTRPETLEGAFDGIHTVYHLAAVLLVEDPRLFRAVNVEGTRNMVRGARDAGVEHFIHVSSASVVYPHATPYSRSKRQGEAEVINGFDRGNYTILRPTLVYHRGGGLEFNLFADYVRRYPVVPLLGDGRALKSPVRAEDLIEGMAAVAGNRATYGKLYNLCGGEAISIRDLASLVLELEGRRKLMIPIPVSLCRVAAAVMGRVMKRPLLMKHTVAGLTQDADLDLSAARDDLGYSPMGVRDGMLQEYR